MPKKCSCEKGKNVLHKDSQLVVDTVNAVNSLINTSVDLADAAAVAAAKSLSKAKAALKRLKEYASQPVVETKKKK